MNNLEDTFGKLELDDWNFNEELRELENFNEEIKHIVNQTTNISHQNDLLTIRHRINELIDKLHHGIDEFDYEVEKAEILDLYDKYMANIQYSDIETRYILPELAREIFIRSQSNEDITDLIKNLTHNELNEVPDIVPAHYYPEVLNLLKSIGEIEVKPDSDTYLEYVALFPEHFAYLISNTYAEVDFMEIADKMMKNYPKTMYLILDILASYKRDKYHDDMIERYAKYINQL